MSQTREQRRHEGKDKNGRFVRGNKYGAGNPYAREVACLREVALHDLSDDDIHALTVKLHLQAMSGDTHAAKLVLQYTLGKPVESAHPDRCDRDELEALRANQAPTTIQRDKDAVPLDVALPAVRAMRATVADIARLQAKQAAQIGEQPAADSQRRNERQPASPAATSATNILETEALCLLDLALDSGRRDDRRAANAGRH